MRRAFIQLGRFGDIINVLPLLKEEADHNRRRTLVVAAPYVDILDGVSYCDVKALDLHYSQIEQAIEICKAEFGDVLVSQVYGWSRGGVEKETASFTMESWRMAGKLARWGKLPLIFDRRSQDRETQLREKWLRGGRPTILVSCASFSSPFRYKTELMRTMMRYFGRDHYIVDLDKVRADRFYDLLGLFDMAKCLVSVDTGHLHLAKASSIPVAALITDTPTTWHGTAPHPNQIIRVPYTQFYQRKIEMMEAIKVLKGSPGNHIPVVETIPAGNGSRRIFHVWSDYPRTGDCKRRHEFAKSTWEAEYRRGRWESCPTAEHELERTSASLGDSRPMPFIHDLINRANDLAHPNDILVITNDDISMVEGITESLLSITTARAAYAHRWDFRVLGRPLKAPQLQSGGWCVGSDLFAFTAGWWRRNKVKFPDMILGREAWDWLMRDLIKDTGGFEIHTCIYHESHPSYWFAGKNRNENLGNRHNRMLAREWLIKRGRPIRELAHFK